MTEYVAFCAYSLLPGHVVLAPLPFVSFKSHDRNPCPITLVTSRYLYPHVPLTLRITLAPQAPFLPQHVNFAVPHSPIPHSPTLYQIHA